MEGRDFLSATTLGEHLAVTIQPTSPLDSDSVSLDLYRFVRAPGRGSAWHQVATFGTFAKRSDAIAKAKEVTRLWDVPYVFRLEIGSNFLPRGVVDATLRRRDAMARTTPDQRAASAKADAILCRNCQTRYARNVLVPNLNADGQPIWQPCCDDCAASWSSWCPAAVLSLQFVSLRTNVVSPANSLSPTTDTTDIFTLVSSDDKPTRS